MASIGLEQWGDTDWMTEVKESMRDALRNPWVAGVALVCATVVIAGVVGVLAWLIFAQRDATMVLSFVSIMINALLYKQLADVRGTVRLVERQTNGTTTRLMDAALKDQQRE